MLLHRYNPVQLLAFSSFVARGSNGSRLGWSQSSVASSPGKVVPLRQVAAFIIDATICFDARSEQGLAHHLRNHDHADVLAQTFVTAEPEMKVVIPVAAGDESLWIFKRFRVEHRRLCDG